MSNSFFIETDDNYQSIFYDVPESALEVSSHEFQCPECGGEITWYCSRDVHNDPRIPPPCGCTNGSCACDHFVCIKCQKMLDKKVFGNKPKHMDGKIIIP